MVYIGRDLTDLKTLEIEEKSYDPRAEIKGLDTALYSRTPVLREIAVVCALNNKSGLTYTDNVFSRVGEPTEAALKVAAEKLGKYDSALADVDFKKTSTPYGFHLGQSINNLAALDFTSERKTMSTVVKGFHGVGNSLLLKGAPERVIGKC